jgi:xanthine dehydrogenase molybdenum-binding subunit
MKENALLLHEELDPEQKGGRNVVPGSVVRVKVGDFDKAWAEGEVFSEAHVKVPIQKQGQLETCAAVADYKSNGELSVCCTTQTPHPVKMALAHVFGLPQSKVRVYNPPYVGGGFGVRIGMSGKAEVIAAALSKLARRPVKLVYTREEDFTCTDSRHGGNVSFKVAAKRNGKITAIQGRAILAAGDHTSYSTSTPAAVGKHALCTYSVPNVDYEGKAVFTNTQSAGAMRGFGTPQGVFALEEAIDSLAKKLNMDPIELRKMNIRTEDEDWFMPYPCASVAMAECIDKAAEGIGWKDNYGKKTTGTKRRGVGIGIGAHSSNSYPSIDFSNVLMRLEEDGSLHVSNCIPEFGTGATTALVQISAEAVGVRFEEVKFTFGDTESTIWELGSHASRTVYTVGQAIVKAGNELRKKIFDYAAKEHFKCDPSQLELRNGIVTGPNKEMTLREVAGYAHRASCRFSAIGIESPKSTPPWHAHAVEVEVDMETGVIEVLKVVAAHDCGVAINPQIVEGQIEGGALMGVGYGISEEMKFSPDGRNYNNSYDRYMLPTICDAPEIESIIVDSYDKTGPYGAKGVGECAMIPTAAAIACAVEDAIGIRFHEIPLTPERVLTRIKEVYGNNMATTERVDECETVA